MKRVLIASLLAGICSISVLAQSESRSDILKQIETKRAELAKLEDQFLAPSAEDRAASSELLSQPDAGLIRLLPREIFDDKVGKKSAMTIRGGGAYYSFGRLTHEYGYGSAIELANGNLLSGFAGADYALMTTIAEVPLETISVDHPSLKFLTSYKVPTEESEARREARAFGGRGNTIDGLLYISRVPVQLNTTYLLRSINYGDSDVLVAFRILSKETDGSITLLWKLLRKYPKPELVRSQATN